MPQKFIKIKVFKFFISMIRYLKTQKLQLFGIYAPKMNLSIVVQKHML